MTRYDDIMMTFCISVEFYDDTMMTFGFWLILADFG